MVSWWVPCQAKGAGLTLIMAQEVTQIVAPFCLPSGVYLSPTRIMAPPQAISILELHLFGSPTYDFLIYLAKGCRPDFNNGLGGDSIVAPFWPPAFI